MNSYYIFLIAAGLMVVLYFVSCLKITTLLSRKHPETFTAIGSPHFLRNNLALLKYIKSKDYHSLNDEEVDALGQAINFLHLAGIALLVFSILVFGALFVR